MTKKILTTTDKYLNTMTPDERAEFDKELRNLALSEMVLAAREGDEVSARKLAKLAGAIDTNNIL